ncbi:Pescadillo [Fulvia fulva]|uniref:Pescadillo homolog n=1 Tax=Passalora fulva TaxID=5499 RepID=A0A9Q8L7Q6_PASFU|nr:Pescadillo [Fulvia fulva]KAK4635798.1 Pescadillo [Fulvia fulva]KAK4636917.1 Pescadillo [Fulvia fulva]UJO12441.1 Pescadillo [Fulvia fulva]WPV08410.1 Pescadillo [Fulvia fulva]WPV24835.1 Pescadillo [Fulvia fulva]
MPKIKKKGTSGAAKNYITRSQAVRKLQISLPDFRRLCIFKGIYPREPRSKKKVSKSSTPSTTYYYTKDIQYLLHEPLLAKFRDQKALAKKISKALGRNQVSDASRLERNLTPRMKLDHIIKERYPTFVDALRDLDDALSMLFLFANLPSTESVPPKTIAKCQRLTMEFEHYLIRTHSLRKSFLSIKGIYYQATIQGQDILWLVPYKFVQRTAGEVDFRIMATFVEFYTTLLGFINYRLYTGIGLVYPPKFDMKSEEQGAELGAFQLQGKDNDDKAEPSQLPDAETNVRAQAEADKLLALPAEADRPEGEADAEQESLQQPSTALDQFASIDPSADTLLQPSITADAASAARLFEPFTFYLSRETPRHPLEFVLKAFGCNRVGWDSLLGEAGSYCSEDDPRITHQIVDRPDLPLPAPPQVNGDDDGFDDGFDDGAPVARRGNERVPGRIYVQPQWVWDSINAGSIQRPDKYAPGATLPPHLSPWVKPRQGDYDPTKSLAEQQTAAEAEESDEDDVNVEGSDGEEVEGVRGDEEAREMEDDLEDDGMAVQLAESDDDEEDEDDADGGAGDDFGGFSDEEDEDLSARQAREHQAELEAEALGRKVKTADLAEKKKTTKAAAQTKRTQAEKAAAEEVERRKMMMPRRKRKTYEKMVYSNARKDEESEKLRAKRRKIEKGATKQKA